LEAAIITTYRCNAKCHMCNIWKHPTSPSDEIRPEMLEKLPRLKFCNITGGEPFLRHDISDIISIMRRKSQRVVVSTNGYFTEKILDIAAKYKDVGFRISIEGLPSANDELRGLKDGFDKGLRTLLGLRGLGIRDIGFGITVSDRNAKDMIELYRLSEAMGVEFATAAVHNSYYFHKYDNQILKVDEAVSCFEELIRRLLRSGRPKNWLRAYFNYGLINYIRGGARLLPCEAGTENFFVDPFGEIRPCNGMDEGAGSSGMGNLNEMGFGGIWDSDRATGARERVRSCGKNCWMIGTAAPVMKKYKMKPVLWVLKNKWKRREKALK